MPTVPTSDALGYNGVGSAPSVQATPADFGAQIGQAEQGVGQDLSRASDTLGDVAMQMKQRQRLIATNNATNGFLADTHTITSGDPNNPNDPGYFGKMGQQAVDGRAQAFTALNNAYQQRLNSLQGDPLAQAQFEQEGRRYLNMTQGMLDQHYEQQSKAALIGSAQSTQQIALQGLGIYAQNEPGWQAHFKTLTEAAQNEVAAKGGTAVEAQAAVQNVTELAKAQRVQTLIGLGDLNGAQSYLQANAPDFKPSTLESLNNMLTPKLRAQQASMAAGNAVSMADAGYNAYLTGRPPAQPGAPSAGTPGVNDIKNAIFNQESGSNPASPTSVNGAVGQAQIMPATFKQFAAPGESITNPADNAAVGQRIIAHYAAQYGNDPARVAVAYFSGPGNVAPPGSPTPYVQDVADGNGKTTSSYVSDVLGRMGGVNGIQSKADYYKANYADIIDQTRQQAMKENPSDPQFADLAVARTEQQIGAVIRQQDLSYAADRDTVLRATNGDLQKGIHPASVAELEQMGPTVSAAWDRLQQNQPEVAHDIATRLMTENAKGQGDSRTYGPAFYDIFNRIHAPDGDPNKITDPSQVLSQVGSGLTMAGLSKVREEIASKGTPDGEAESAMRSTFFKNAHGQISGTDDGMGLKDPQGESQYLRFMAQAYPQIAALKAEGKTPAQIYSPDSPDYVGKAIPAFKRSLAQRTADMMSANGDVTTQPPAQQPGIFSRMFGGEDEPDLSNPAAIKAAYAAGKIDRGTAIKKLTGMAPQMQPAQTE
jgi:hypothetical protein